MTIEYQSFAGAVQGRISAPAGWSFVNGALKRWTSFGAGEVYGDPFGQMVFDTYSAGLRKISAPMRWNSAGSGCEWGFCFVNSSGTGFSLIVKNSSTTLRKEVAGSGGATIATLSTTNTANADFDLLFNDSTGAITVQKNGSSVLTGTYTDTPNLKAGIQSYSSGVAQSYASVSVEYSPAQLITSINGGNQITAGQTIIPIEASGFTAKPTGVTATYAAGAKSISATIGSGTATSFNISIQDRVEGEDWPLNGDTITFTFTYGSESASGTQTLAKKATETVLTFSGAITSDPATLTYWLTQDGFTVEGGELVYDPYGDLILIADGGGSATDAGTFTSWFRPATGTGVGNVYEYQWIITEDGISPASSNVFAKKISCRKISATKISSRGV